MKSLVQHLINGLNFLAKWLERKTSSPIKDSNIVINALAPRVITDDTELKKIRPYLDSLKAAIDKGGINNIALTGGYGSGKSTILKTFQHQYPSPRYKYLNISLSSFDGRVKAKIPQGEELKARDDFERKLEISILQQMFYHVKPDDIPDSRFKRIVNLTNKRLFVHALLFIVWILSALLLVKFEHINKLNPDTWHASYPLDWLTIISVIVFFSGVGFFIKTVYRLFSNSKINKLNIKGELELGEAVDKSVFNQHLEEILYFFERKKYDVVIIEDVDRFDSTDIFTKLREINVLINSSRLINHPVKFVYAIKDDMFKDKNERVKFFEFIIPVISFINPGNANDQLEKLINDAGLQGQLSTEFTSDIVTYIDDIDMRLLINIFQEYQIYRKVLDPGLSQDKLFAILVYKNLNPDDFGELIKRQGKLFKLISNKGEYTKKLNEDIQSKLTDLNKLISQLEGELMPSIEELRMVYIGRIISKIQYFQKFHIDGPMTIEELLTDTNFEKFRKRNEIKYIKLRYEEHYDRYRVETSPAIAGIKFSDIENEINPGKTYLEREDIIRKRIVNSVESLKKDIEQLKKQSAEIATYNLQEIFANQDIAPHLTGFENSYLMRNLLLNGYIDEHYEDYTSLFHGVSITQADFEFERRVKSGISSPPEYELTRIENIIKKLPERYFKKEVIWNYDLVGYLLSNRSKYNTKLTYLFDGLKENAEKQFQFIYNYSKQSSGNLQFFVETICRINPSFWQYIDSKSALPAEEIKGLVKLIFEYAQKNSLYAFESVSTLEEYVAVMPDFFAFCKSLSQTRTIQAFVTEKNIRLQNLDMPDSTQKQLFATIYTQHNYQINEHNILKVIEANGIEYNEDDFKKSQYTVVQNLNLKELNAYLDLNINDYVSKVLLKSNENNSESEATLVRMINRDDIENDVLVRFLNSQENVIYDLNQVKDVGKMGLILELQKAYRSWENVLKYFDSVGEENFNERLINYLNQIETYKVLAFDDFISLEGKDEEYYKKISELVIHCKDLNSEAYANLVRSIPYTYDRMNYEDVDTTKINILLDQNKLNFTAENYGGLNAVDMNLAKRLAELHQSKFIELFDELDASGIELIQIFRSKTFSYENKLLLFEKMDDSLVVENLELADAVCAILPTNKFVPMRYEVLEAIFKSHKSVQKRIEILLLHAANIDDEQLQTLTEKLGADYAKLFVKQNKPVFQNSRYNTDLFDLLKARDMIIRYELNEGDGQIKVFAKYTD